MTRKPVRRPKPAPTDATLRNIRALKARVVRLEDEVAILASRVDGLMPVGEPEILRGDPDA